MNSWLTVLGHGSPLPVPEYIGMTEEFATDLIRDAGYYPYISNRDGIEYPMSASLSPTRIALCVENNVVTKASQG